MKKLVNRKKAATISGLWALFVALEKRLISLEDREVKDVFKPTAQGQFCVIGNVARNGFGGNIGRTWKGTQQQAEDHAASILRNNPGCPELLVVQVVSKVGRKEPDIKITRV